MTDHRGGILTSSLGQKSIVAITGVGLFGFVIAHLLGNLQFFLGPKALNDYAATLKSMPAILWPARIGLLAFFVAHIYFTISLKRKNMAARPVPYAYQNTIQATVASRTMAITGIVLLAYVLFHLAHFTFGWTHPEQFHQLDPQGRHDVYAMVVAGFKNPLVSLFYVVAIGILSFHLSHGVASFFQTLGVTSIKNAPRLRAAALGIALFIFAGYSIIPLYVLFAM